MIGTIVMVTVIVLVFTVGFSAFGNNVLSIWTTPPPDGAITPDPRATPAATDQPAGARSITAPRNAR